MSSSDPFILSLGEVLWDLFPDGARFGGAPANFACHAASLGARVAIASAIGGDPRGRKAREFMRSFGVDVGSLQSCPEAPTGVVTVSVEEGRGPRYRIEEGAAWDFLDWNDSLATMAAEADAVYFGTLGQRSEVSRSTIRRALATAAESGALRILDVNLRPPFCDELLIRESVELATVLKLSDEEFEVVLSACGVGSMMGPEAALRSLVKECELDLAVMTRGSEGALLVSAEEICDQPGMPVEVRDTVGAGDSFTAALVVGLLREEPLAEIARKACALAAHVCGHVGAVPQPPDSQHPDSSSRAAK